MRANSVVLLTLLAATAVHGQAQDTPKNKRLVYIVKHADARELAGALEKHFKGEAEAQAATANALLISVSPGVFDETIKVLEQLDRKPQSVAVEIFLADVLPVKNRTLDAKTLVTGPNEVADRLEALRKEGAVGSVKRVQLTALDGQPSSLMIGEQKPMVSAVNAVAGRFGGPGGGGAGGPGGATVQRSLTYRNVGLSVNVLARVTADSTITLNLQVEDSRLYVPADGAEIGKDENGTPIRASEMITINLKTAVSLRSGQAVLAEGVQNDSKTGAGQSLVIVAARILE